MRKRKIQSRINHLRCENFGAKVQESILFENVNLSLNVGQFAVLYGPRGSGKSAFLRSFALLNREVYPNIEYSGNVYLDDTSLFQIDEKEVRQIVTYLDTNFLESLDYLTFKDLVRLVFGSHYKFKIEDHATELDNFGVLKALYKFEKTPLSSLYVLEKIGLLLFVSTVRQSSVLVLDCLLDHLDDEHVESVTKMLRELSEYKVVILATRTLKRFIGLGDVLIVMKSGQVKFFGDPKEYVLGV
ncbi:ABC-type cobalamin/Fe3+-siderophores transport system, ATPase component [Fervidobacterium changbaicum]|uniref:ABC transporter ATP-binding protein n=1 Tax=Fervidobacterium changbaicum TaxID=310769 RepID=A0ABX5QQQ9_9BACT|nr:ATP-binding cassette domain-containing protein [Fervidobacterium changbaicum]QAV32800.1 ABC transporter ATP-binding protein [Fervidobacterium changbaicum]SDG95032.1 ABC-type cobalamin/Fe3+-siderophores transport system, ATPase component [Fervidobacterium changbaicum]